MKTLIYIITTLLLTFLLYTEISSANEMQNIFNKFDKKYYNCAITHEDYISYKIKKGIKIDTIIQNVEKSCEFAINNNLPSNPSFR
mgnify:CR=1 FL=1